MHYNATARNALQCTSEYTHTARLAFMKGAVQRRDELLDLFNDLLRDGHRDSLVINQGIVATLRRKKCIGGCTDWGATRAQL